ncbi:MAG: arsenate reductase (glutaredoxin) [Neisseriaceae bacterium]|nr:arsenate reductase (glutaredoxin) [Neisseriaceae bacterium]
MAITLYHNPRCSKSREALAALQALGHTPEVVLYLETPPDAATLADVVHKLGLPARALLRTKEAEYAELGLADASLDDARLIAAMVAHPKLIERPIAIVGNRAAIGRPLDAILALLA